MVSVEREIRAEMVRIGITTEELAIKAHMSKATLSRRLRKIEDMTLGECWKIEKALHWERGKIGELAR